jgi:prohibitin 2
LAESCVKLELVADIQIPWLETAVIYDVRAKPRNIASLTGTKDLQMVS